jgi:fatty acid desaturase
MEYKEWAEKEKKKAIEERKKLKSIETEKVNMESKAKKQKSSTGEKIAKAIITLSIVIIMAGVITAIASTIAYGGDESTPLLAKIVIYAGGITMLAWVVIYIVFAIFSEYEEDEEEFEDDWFDWYPNGKRNND